SGTILIAKNAWAHQQFDRQLAAGAIKRLYLAVCQGAIQPASARINAPIQSNSETPKREIHADGKPAVTRYHRLHSSPAASLLAVKLFTGRTHQIRVHLAYLHHPLWGDAIYGQAAADFARPALHAAKLTFRHPRTGQLLKFKAPLPEDLQMLIRNLRLE
ncbi:MAG TPA: pseudouridine synthase, partial [Bacillota bacterium]|nr:pseudouridine synthase [Bacillota bacterium]